MPGKAAKSTLGGRLPPGFAASEASVPNPQTGARITVTAPPDARTEIISPGVFGSAQIAGETVRRKPETTEALMQAFAHTHDVPTQRLFLAVLPRPPVRSPRR